ncbi:Hypothetical protein (Fragment) [Durusdinium trenchii]
MAWPWTHPATGVFLLHILPVLCFEWRMTWEPKGLSGCLDDPYYFDVFFLYLGRGTCRLNEGDTTGNGGGTTSRHDPQLTLEACLDVCFSIDYCTGVEFQDKHQRCEVWNRSIGFVRGSSSFACVGQKEVDCSYFAGKNCTAEIYDRNASEKLERLHSACPNACTEVQPVCPSDFSFMATQIGGLYLTSGGAGQTQNMAGEQYESGYNMFFEVNGQASAVRGQLSVTALSVDGTLQDISGRASFLSSRIGTKLMLGPWGDDTFEAVAAVADADQVVLMGPLSKVNASVAHRSTVFSMTRPYSEMLLAPFELIAQQGAATVSVITPSWARAQAEFLVSNFKTCETVPQTAGITGLVFLRSEILENLTTAHVADVMDHLLTPRPDVIVCCESSVTCATAVLNTTYHKDYDAKAFIIFDDDLLTGPLNFAAANLVNNNDVNTFLLEQLQIMGTVQTQAALDLWKFPTYLNMAGYSSDWSSETMELLKDCLVVSDWDRSTPGAAAFMYLQYYLVRTHARPESAAASAAAAILLKAVQEANSTNPQAVAEALASLQVLDPVLGEVVFDATGHRVQLTSTMQLGTTFHWLPGVYGLRFAMKYLTPAAPVGVARRREPLAYPKMSWRMSTCYNQFLPAADGLAYGLSRNNETGRDECVPCSEFSSSTWDSRAHRRICLICPPGTESWQGNCRPCQAGYFSEQPGSSSCSPCSAGFFQSQQGQNSCLPCPAGTFSAGSGSHRCTPCSETFDVLNDELARWAPEGSVSCINCPFGAECQPDNNGLYTNFTNAEGYYIFPDANLSQQAIFSCNHGNGLACLESRQCYSDPNTGEVAMEGPMCGSCRPGFAKPTGKPLDLCRKCGSRTANVVGVSLQLLTVVGMASFLMIVNALSDYSKPKNILSIILKQFFNYIQMAFAVLSTGGDHGLYGGLSLVQAFDLGQDYLGLNSAAWVPEASACLIQDLFPSWEIHKVYTVIGLAWFPGTALVSMLVYLFVKLVRRLLKKSDIDTRHLKTWMMINFFLYVPRVNRLLMVNFKCQQYDTSRLTLNPQVLCWSNDHAVWQTISWGGVLVFSCGGPLFLYLILRRLQKNQLLSSWRSLRTYGFLFAGFEPDFYYFECIYMFRKICFELVMTIPGMTSEDEAILGRINNSSVAFVASIFFALHMACQPYDNRDYFILDRIETASLRAILVTAFLQLWCLDTNEADGIKHNEWLRQGRNLVGTVVILLFHLRFYWLFFYGMARRRVQQCMAACRGRTWAHGTCVFVPDGIQLRNLNEKEEQLLSSMIAQIFETHVQVKGKIAYDNWAGSLQALCLEAKRGSIGAELVALDRVGHTLRSWREIGRKLFRGSRAGAICERFFDWLEDCNGVVSNAGSSYEKLKRQKDRDMEELQIFGADSLNKILNSEFRVEELQDAMLTLGKSICDNKRIPGLGLSGSKEDKTSFSQAMEFYVGPLALDDNIALALEERTRINEVEELRKEVNERHHECMELRRQLLSLCKSKASLPSPRQSLRSEVSVQIEQESVSSDRASETVTKLWQTIRENEELTAKLQTLGQAWNEAVAERDGFKADCQQLQAALEKEEERKSEAQATVAEQQSKLSCLEDQLKRIYTVRAACWSCGAKMPEGALYCFKCGKDLDGEQEDSAVKR